MTELDPTRRDLATAFAAAGHDLLRYTRTDTALAAIPDTEPQLYAIAGTLDGMARMLPKIEGARAPAGLTDERIGQLYREAQDQSTSGVSPSIYLARAVERELLALRAPAGLEGLTRWDFVNASEGESWIEQAKSGDYVLFDDVERLLATQAVEPAAQAEAAGDHKKLLQAALDAAGKWTEEVHLHARNIGSGGPGSQRKVDRLRQKAMAAINALAEVSATPAPQQVAQASRNSVPHMLTVETIQGAIAFGRMGINPPPSPDHWGNEFWQIGRQLAKLGETSAWDNVTLIEKPEVQASRNDVLEEAIAVIPGGSICDPQHVADAIRALKGEA